MSGGVWDRWVRERSLSACVGLDHAQPTATAHHYCPPLLPTTTAHHYCPARHIEQWYNGTSSTAQRQTDESRHSATVDQRRLNHSPAPTRDRLTSSILTSRHSPLFSLYRSPSAARSTSHSYISIPHCVVLLRCTSCEDAHHYSRLLKHHRSTKSLSNRSVVYLSAPSSD